MSAVIHFACGEESHVSYIYDDQCTYFFVFKTKLACAQQEKSSGISTFLWLVFLGLSVYAIGGVLYNRSRGLRGIEQVPNIEFWRSLRARVSARNDAASYSHLSRDNDHLMNDG